MTTEVAERNTETPVNIIQGSKFARQFTKYWSNASTIERNELQKWYLEKIKEGSESWNEWAQELESFIEANGLHRHNFTIFFINPSSKESDFSNFLFPVPVSFINCSLRSTDIINFDFTTFKSSAVFTNTNFNSIVTFRKATFNKSANFSQCTFTENTDFTSAHFIDVAYFNECKFKGVVLFHNTDFNSDGHFMNAEFCSKSEFTNTTFFALADFLNCTFNNDAQFTDASFLSTANFSNAAFKQVSNFRRARFTTHVPEFNYCEFKQPPYLSQMEIPEIYLTGFDSNTEKYRRLKSLAITSHDHEQELKFFSYEMKSKMADAGHTQTTSIYTPLKLYEWTSNFGKSIGRPVACFLGLWVMSIVLHYAALEPVDSCKGESVYSKEWAVVSYASSHSFPLFLSDRRAKKATDDCLFGVDVPPPAFVNLAGFGQSFFSMIFAFLIGLGIRNRFKIK